VRRRGVVITVNDTLRNLIDDIWYGRHPARLALLPLSWLYRGLVSLRRWVSGPWV